MHNYDHAIEKARQLAQTSTGRQLNELMRQLGGNDLESALASAASGDYGKLEKELQRLLKNPQARKLLESMEW